MSASASKAKKSLTFNPISEQRAYYEGKEGEGEGEGEEGEIYEPEKVDTFIKAISEPELPKEVIRLSSPHSSSKRYKKAELLPKPVLVLSGDDVTRYLKLMKIKKQLQKEYNKAKFYNNKPLKKLIKKDLANIESSIEELYYLRQSRGRGIMKTRKMFHSHKKQPRTQTKRNRVSRKSKKNNKNNKNNSKNKTRKQ